MYLVFVIVGSHLFFSHTHLHCLANNLPCSPPEVAVDHEKIYYNAIFASFQQGLYIHLKSLQNRTGSCLQHPGMPYFYVMRRQHFGECL